MSQILTSSQVKELTAAIAGTDYDILIGLKSIGINAAAFTESDFDKIEAKLPISRNEFSGVWE